MTVARSKQDIFEPQIRAPVSAKALNPNVPLTKTESEC